MRKPQKTPSTRRAPAALLVAMTLGTGIIPSPTHAGEGGDPSMSGLPGVAAREIARRLEAAQQADVIAAEGDRLMADGNYAGALEKYREALNLLPVAAATDAQRQSIIERFSAAAIAEARKLAAEGDYAKARTLLEEVLNPSIDPDNREAKRLLEQLDDPDRFPPARSRELTDNIKEVERLLHLGESHFLLGEYDKAEVQFFKILTIDRYNVAAREFLENIERVRIDYYGASYNHTRARMLRMVDQTWEVKPPLQKLPPGMTGGDDLNVKDLRFENSVALQTIIIPKVSFEEATLADAVAFLRSSSKQFDPRPGKPGVNILIRSAPTVADQSQNAGEKIIPELNLNNLPLGEVLRYLCEMTQMRVRIEQFAVVLVPLTDTDVELYTRTFRVSPDFIPQEAGGGTAPGAEIDPFGGGGGGGGGAPALPTRLKAKDYLISRGVPFGENASADFDPRTTTLTVRNTPQAMEMVEGLVELDAKNQPKQVTIETKFVEVQQRNGKELGFDWLLGPAVVNSSQGIAVAGGSAGTGIAPVATNFPFVDPLSPLGADPLPVGRNPVTAGNRSGDFAITRNAIDSILNTSIGDVGADQVAPGILGIAGLLTEPQFQMVIRALDQKKGTDLLSAPSVTTKPGLPARIEIIREFIYPTEYDPPELPNSVGSDTNLGGGGSGLPGVSPASVTTFPVTPATPAAFETRNVGVTLEVDPVVGANGFTIDLTLTPEVVEFEGFINYGNPITSGAIDALGRPTQVVITENRIEMPIFSTRRVKTQVTVWDGQTVAIGGLIREDVQNIEDKVPLLGDMPLVGRLFKTKAEERFKRNLMVFVTARLIDPAGKPINQMEGDDFGGGGMVAPESTPADPTGGGALDNALLQGADGLPSL